MADPTPEKSGPAGKPIGGKASAPGGPKPPSAVTKPPAGGAPKPATPAAGGAARPGGPPKDAGFKVIRSAPAAEGGSATPLVIGGAVIALVIGAYFVIDRKPAGDKTKPPVTSTDPSAQTEVQSGPDVPHPDAVDERLDFLVNEGRMKDALAYAEEKLKEYPNAKLRARRDELRGRAASGSSGTEAPAEGADALLSQAEAALSRGNAAEAMAKLDEVLARDGLPEAISGKAYYLHALTNVRAGDLLAAGNDLDNAASMNFDPQKCDQLRAQIAASQQPR